MQCRSSPTSPPTSPRSSRAFSASRSKQVRITSPFLLRTVDPPLSSVDGRTVQSIRRIGKRIAIGVEGDLWLVLHLMIAGRLHWRPRKSNSAAARISPHSISLPAPSSSLKPAANAAPHSISSAEKRPCPQSIPAASKSSQPISTASAPLSRSRIEPSSAHSLIRASSAESAMRTPTRFSTPRSSRPSRSRTSSYRKNGSVCTPPHAQRSTLWIDRLRAEARKISLKRSPRFGLKWPCMAASTCPARAAARRSSAFATLTTKPTTAPSARPAEKSSPIAACRAFSGPTGPALSTNWKPSNADNPRISFVLRLLPFRESAPAFVLTLPSACSRVVSRLLAAYLCALSQCPWSVRPTGVGNQ